MKWLTRYIDHNLKEKFEFYETKQQALSDITALNIGSQVELMEVHRDVDGDWTCFDPTKGYSHFRLREV